MPALSVLRNFGFPFFYVFVQSTSLWVFLIKLCPCLLKMFIELFQFWRHIVSRNLRNWRKSSECRRHRYFQNFIIHAMPPHQSGIQIGSLQRHGMSIFFKLWEHSKIGCNISPRTQLSLSFDYRIPLHQRIAIIPLLIKNEIRWFKYVANRRPCGNSKNKLHGKQHIRTLNCLMSFRCRNT